MEQPKGFVASGQEHVVSRLNKSLYGLNHAPRLWYKKFDHFIELVGFSKSDEDHCVFTKTAHHLRGRHATLRSAYRRAH